MPIVIIIQVYNNNKRKRKSYLYTRYRGKCVCIAYCTNIISCLFCVAIGTRQAREACFFVFYSTTVMSTDRSFTTKFL